MSGPKGPLEGITVIGLEHSVAAPLCTRILGDLGADVIKVERPGGDFARQWDDHVAGESAQFWWLNRGKRSIVLDLRVAADRNKFDRLLTGADVLVHNLSPKAAGRLGLDAPALQEAFPRLVNCQISGYGAISPMRDRKAYDMLVQAEVGVMSLTGTEAEKMRVGVSICDVASGLYAATCVIAALMEQRSNGRGRYLDIGMFDVGLELVGPMLLSFVNAGVIYPRLPHYHHAIAPYGVFSCRDGEIVLAIQQDAEWVRFCREVLRDQHAAEDPHYRSNLERVANRKGVNRLVSQALATMSLVEAEAVLQEHGFAFARVNDMETLAQHPVTTANGALRAEVSASGQPVTALEGLAHRVFGLSPDARGRPPALDEDRALLSRAAPEAEDESATDGREVDDGAS